MMKVYIKNYEKNGKKTQVLVVSDNDGNYYHYFVNYSKNKNSVYLTPSKDVKE